MSNHYSDPTANAAMGAVDKKIAYYQKWNKRLLHLKANGAMTREDLEKARREFTGFYSRFLTVDQPHPPEIRGLTILHKKVPKAK